MSVRISQHVCLCENQAKVGSVVSSLNKLKTKSMIIVTGL